MGIKMINYKHTSKLNVFRTIAFFIYVVCKQSQSEICELR